MSDFEQLLFDRAVRVANIEGYSVPDSLLYDLARTILQSEHSARRRDTFIKTHSHLPNVTHLADLSCDLVGYLTYLRARTNVNSRG